MELILNAFYQTIELWVFLGILLAGLIVEEILVG
jgi:hypothetical protein